MSLTDNLKDFAEKVDNAYGNEGNVSVRRFGSNWVAVKLTVLDVRAQTHIHIKNYTDSHQRYCLNFLYDVIAQQLEE